MKRLLLLMPFFFLLAGCSAKPAPSWLTNGHRYLETYKGDFLGGRGTGDAESHFNKAVTEIKRSGDLNLLGRVLLTRMALRVAVLEKGEESHFPKVEKAQPSPTNRSFYLFLKGDLSAVDGTFLPAQYRPLLEALRIGDVPAAERAVAAIDDPLSRLVACGVAFNHRMQSEALLGMAIETAAVNGWQRALLAWLRGLQAFYETRNDFEQVQAIGQRIDLIKP